MKFFLIIIVLFSSCNNRPRQVINNVQVKITHSSYLVPDEVTATKIAEAIWLPIYGEQIYNEKPYRAFSKDSIWIVKGTLKGNMVGGVAYIEILKKNAKVLKVTHYR